jgi:hypothetical protein
MLITLDMGNRSLAALSNSATLVHRRIERTSALVPCPTGDSVDLIARMGGS